MKKSFLIAGAVLLSTLGWSQDRPKGNETIQVKGNCEMCKKRIEKAALAVKGVRSADWSTENRNLQLYLNPKKADLKKVEEAIAKAGHDTQNIKASEESYKSLHSCCQYDR